MVDVRGWSGREGRSGGWQGRRSWSQLGHHRQLPRTHGLRGGCKPKYKILVYKAQSAKEKSKKRKKS